MVDYLQHKNLPFCPFVSVIQRPLVHSHCCASIKAAFKHLSAQAETVLRKQITPQSLICQRYKRRGFDPWVGKIPWRRKWKPTDWYSWLENATHRGAWRATVPGVSESDPTEHVCFCICILSTYPPPRTSILLSMSVNLPRYCI